MIARTAEDVTMKSLYGFVKEYVLPKSTVFTDEFASYFWLDSSEFVHQSVNHTKQYVAPGNIHCNGVENVWSLLKRGVMGTFHNVGKEYLPLYLAEFQFRHNNRKNLDIFKAILAGC